MNYSVGLVFRHWITKWGRQEESVGGAIAFIEAVEPECLVNHAKMGKDEGKSASICVRYHKIATLAAMISE